MSIYERRIRIGKIASIHTEDEAIAVIESGRLNPEDPATNLDPQDEFTYRHSIAYDHKKGFSNLKRFMLSMYGRDYLDAPQLTEMYYRDIETRAQHVGSIALFTNLYNKNGLTAVTVGILGDTAAYPANVRLSAQSANFNNTLGLSGLTRVRLETYQRVVLDQNGQVDPLRSVLSNTPRFNPFLVEHIKLHDDLTVISERKDVRVGADEIQMWANSHPDYQEYVEGTVYAVQAGVTNPVSDFIIPQNNEGFRNLASLERLMDFEYNDDL